MRCFYLDTSALAKRYAYESGTEMVDALIADKDNTVVIGNIAVTELYSALSKKRRTGEISEQDFLSALYRFEKDIAEKAYRFLEVDNHIIAATKILILSYPTLRTYDAIHLALALELFELHPTIVASDETLIETCRAEGLAVINPGL